MQNELIIKKLKKQIQTIGKIQFKNNNDPHLINWINTTRIYLVYLNTNKDTQIKKEYIKMYDNLIKNIQENNQELWNKESIVINLQNILKTIIDITEDENKKSQLNIRICTITEEDITNIEQVEKKLYELIDKKKLSKDKKQEVKNKFEDLKIELNKDKVNNRSKTKEVLKWFADYGKDECITILPIIGKHYRKEV